MTVTALYLRRIKIMTKAEKAIEKAFQTKCRLAKEYSVDVTSIVGRAVINLLSSTTEKKLKLKQNKIIDL